MTEDARTNTAAIARRMWALFEPVHVISYFATAPREAFEQAGLRGFWRGYFAGRAAPIGLTGAAPVVASFFSFAPGMVARAVPGVWDLIMPRDALAVRQAGAVAALRSLLALPDGSTVPAPVVAAADRLADLTADLGCAGRTLGAANAALPVPAESLARLWHAATVLREHRGDGHIAALVAADLDGPEALALRAGVDRADGGLGHVSAGWSRNQMQPARGWTDEEWDAAALRLAGRGLLQADGTATKAGVALHRDVEHATDVSAARPWAALRDKQVEELADLLLPVARACAAVLPVPNPVGVPAPAVG